MKNKRKATLKQAAALRIGREKLFEKQRRQKGIPKKIIQNVPVQVPGQTKYVPVKSSSGLKINLSIFNSLVETKFFPIEINKNREVLNIRELINYIFARLKTHWSKISSHENRLNKIVNHINSKDKENEDRFRKLEKRISDLEKENEELKERGEQS